MELLGFYDQPYQVAVSRPPLPARARQIVRATHDNPPALHHTSQVATLWETTELEEGALDWWKPQVIARRKLGGRQLRTSSTLGAVVIGLVLSILAWTLLQRPGQMAAESRAAIHGSAAALEATLDPLRELALTLGGGVAPDLAASSATTLEAEAEARALFTAAGDLPESDEELRAAVVGAASAVLDATARINRLVAYRVTAEGLLLAPDLPAEAGPDRLPELTGLVAEWRAGLASGVDDLPEAVLPQHRAELEGWVAGLESWQAEYLDAVREQEAETVAAAADAIRADLVVLHDSLLAQLERAGNEIAGEVEEAERALGGLVGA